MLSNLVIVIHVNLIIKSKALCFAFCFILSRERVIVNTMNKIRQFRGRAYQLRESDCQVTFSMIILRKNKTA